MPESHQRRAKALHSEQNNMMCVYCLCAFLHKFLCLINLRRKVRTPSSIGMVKQHHLPVLLPYHLFRYAAFTALPSPVSITDSSPQTPRHPLGFGVRTVSPISTPLPSGSSWLRSRLCRKLFPVHLCRHGIFGVLLDLRDPSLC